MTKGSVSSWVARQQKVVSYRPAIDWTSESRCDECGREMSDAEQCWQMHVSALGPDGGKVERVFDVICEGCFQKINDLILDRE